MAARPCERCNGVGRRGLFGTRGLGVVSRNCQMCNGTGQHHVTQSIDGKIVGGQCNAKGTPKHVGDVQTRKHAVLKGPVIAFDAHDMPSAVPILLDGDEDPRVMMHRGEVEVLWGCGGEQRKIRRFRERPLSRVADADSLVLPKLYLHMLDSMFLPNEHEMNKALRSGNDNSEIQLVLPERFVNLRAHDIHDVDMDSAMGENLNLVLDFILTQGEVQTSEMTTSGGGGQASINTNRLYFRLATSRPKSAVTLDKSLFGIPEDAELYLFAQNHPSIRFMSDEVRQAFGTCIDWMSTMSGNEFLRPLGVFLKVFYEGGFAYNRKHATGVGNCYLPKNVGVGALGVVPTHDAQAGISTGLPYHIGTNFFKFTDTVPVTIDGIKQMSQRHGRYGLCFTRCVFVWDGGILASDGVLDFCAAAPHGGFFYVPEDPAQYSLHGGVLYPFGEDRQVLDAIADQKMLEEPAVLDHCGKRVAFCLDYSGSMGGNKIQAAVASLLTYFDEHIDDDDEISLDYFNHANHVVFDLSKKCENLAQKRQSIEALTRPTGGTALYDTVMNATEKFEKLESGHFTNWIVVLTDGRDGNSRVTLGDMKARLKAASHCLTGLVIIGVGHDVHTTLLTDVAKLTERGAFIAADNATSISAAFERAANIMEGSVNL